MQRMAAAKQIGRWLVTAACVAAITSARADVWAEEDETPTPVTVTVGGDGNPTLAVAIDDAKEDNTTPVIFSITTNQTGDETFNLSGLTTVTLKSSAASTSRVLKLADNVTGRVLAWNASGNTPNGTLTLIELLISSDIPAIPAVEDDEGTPAAIRLGGGLSLDNLEAVTATRLTLYRNKIEIAEGNAGNALGGGLSLTNTLSANFTGAVFGYYSSSDTEAEIAKGVANANIAQNDGIGNSEGGGAYIADSVGANFTSSVFSYNKAVANTGDALGGGASLVRANQAIFTSATVVDNEATSTSGNAIGGGVAITDSQGSYTAAIPAEGENPAVDAVDKRINFSSSRIYTNSATSYGGVAQGGGVAVTNSKFLVFDKATFSGNHAKAVAEVVDEGEAPEQSGKYAYGGGLFLNDVSNVSLKQTYFGYNTATATGPDAVAAFGGGVYLKSVGDSNIDFTSAYFTYNTATSTASALGGALYVDGGNVDLTGSIFTYNKAVVTGSSGVFAGGGAIYAQNSSDSALKLNLTDARFSDNEVTWSDDETDTLRGGDVLLDANGVDGMVLMLGTTTNAANKWSGWLGNKTGSKNAITFSNSGESDATINVNVNVGSACLLHMQDGMIGEAGAKVVFDINKDNEDNVGEWWLGGTSVFKNADTCFTVYRGAFGIYDRVYNTAKGIYDESFLDLSGGKIEIKDGATLAIFTYTAAADAAIRNAKLTFDDGGKLQLVMRDADYSELAVGESKGRYFADDDTIITGLTEDQIGDTSTSFSGSPLFKLTYNPNNSNAVTLTRQSTAVMLPKAPSEIINLLDTYRGGNKIITDALNQDDVSPDALLFSAFNSTGVVNLSQQSFATSSLVTAMSRTAPRTPMTTNTVRGQYRKKRKDQGLWVMPVYSHDAARNLRAGGHRYGYTANQYGAVFGLDRFIEMFGSGGRLGFAGSAGGGTSTSNGDLLRTTGSTGFGSIYIYGDFAVSGWSQVNLAWNVGWLGSSTTVKQDYLGGRSEATVPGGSFFFAVAAERPFQIGKLCLTPSVELRYNLVYQQEFDTRWGDFLFTTTEAATGHAVTLPIGIDASLQYEVYGGTWMPLVGVSVIPNIGDRELKYSVNTVGSVIPPSMRSVIVDAIGGECQFGSHWMRRNFEWGVDYRYLFSEHFQTHNVSLLMKWCF